MTKEQAKATCRLSHKLRQSINDALKSGMPPMDIMADLRTAAKNPNKSPAYRDEAKATADDVANYLKGLGYNEV